MKQVLCVFALGLSLSACASYDPGYYEEYGYYGYGRPGSPGRYVREQQCYEVRTTFQHPYVECRYVNRWKPEYKHHHKRRWRDRDRDDDDDDDYYSSRSAKKRWKEYYD